MRHRRSLFRGRARLGADDGVRGGLLSLAFDATHRRRVWIVVRPSNRQWFRHRFGESLPHHRLLGKLRGGSKLEADESDAFDGNRVDVLHGSPLGELALEEGDDAVAAPFSRAAVVHEESSDVADVGADAAVVLPLVGVLLAAEAIVHGGGARVVHGGGEAVEEGTVGAGDATSASEVQTVRGLARGVAAGAARVEDGVATRRGDLLGRATALATAGGLAVPHVVVVRVVRVLLPRARLRVVLLPGGARPRLRDRLHGPHAQGRRLSLPRVAGRNLRPRAVRHGLRDSLRGGRRRLPPRRRRRRRRAAVHVSLRGHHRHAVTPPGARDLRAGRLSSAGEHHRVLTRMMPQKKTPAWNTGGVAKQINSLFDHLFEPDCRTSCLGCCTRFW